jgi:CRISPR-associated protein Cmr1
MSKKIETIRVTYHLTTPLFCGGADPAVPELRLPSFKGVLRWYWRAVVWAPMRGDLKAIHEAEQRLFGSPGGGQGKVSMRWAPGMAKPTLREKDDVLQTEQGRTVGQGARYLGYGVMVPYGTKEKSVDGRLLREKTEDGQLLRGCALPPLTLTIELRCRELTPDERDSLLRALRALGLLGGMGAKSRKGYGSLMLQELSIDGAAQWRVPSTIGELRERIVELRRGCASEGKGAEGVPEYSALTAQSRHILLAGSKSTDTLGLLDGIGRELVKYRSWGRNGVVLGDVPREETFKSDHDMMKAAEKGKTPSEHPRRVAFGLPHNYGKDKEVVPTGLDRRASPLLIHIHLCGSTPVAVLSFLPARFLPEGTEILAFGTTVPVTPLPKLWEPITALLDRFLHVFSTAVEVQR